MSTRNDATRQNHRLVQSPAPHKNGKLLTEVHKSMYGLPHAGRAAYDKLPLHLKAGCYVPTKHTPGLFRHQRKPITLTLIINDFGVKYEDRVESEDLVALSKKKYNTTIDWKGTNYCGMQFQWNCKKRAVELSIPEYTNKAICCFLHKTLC